MVPASTSLAWRAAVARNITAVIVLFLLAVAPQPVFASDICDCSHQGDCNGDRQIDVADAVYMLNYAFRDGPPPPDDPDCPLIHRADWNCDDHFNLVDMVSIFQYLFRDPSFTPCIPCVPCADVYPLSFTYSGPDTVSPGQVIGQHLNATVANGGSLPTTVGCSVGFYVSDDANITTGDRLLIGGREFVSQLDPGMFKTVSIYTGMRIPPDYPVGPAFLGILIDEYNQIPECDEGNNDFAIPIVIE